MGEDRLATLSAVRPWALSDGELVAALDLVHALRVEAEAVSVRLLREFDVRNGAAVVGATSAAVWYRNRHLVSIRSAYRLVRLAKRIDAAPAVVGEAVADGRVNLDQADVVTRAVARIPAEVGVDIREQAAAELVRLCAELDPQLLTLVGDRILAIVAPEIADELDRKALEHAEAQAARERYFTLTPDGVGMRLSGRLTADGAAIVRAAIGPLTKPTTGDGRTPEQRRADALVEICRLALASAKLPRNGGERPHLALGVDFDVVNQQLSEGRLDNGDRITPETVRRIACDCGIVPIVFTGPGQPVDLGRHRRLVNGPLRRALAARDRGCAFPSCARSPQWTTAHHIRHWSHGVPTAPDNLVLLCGHHHTESTNPTTGPSSSPATVCRHSSHPSMWTRNSDPSATSTTGGSEANGRIRLRSSGSASWCAPR